MRLQKLGASNAELCYKCNETQTSLLLTPNNVMPRKTPELINCAQQINQRLGYLEITHISGRSVSSGAEQEMYVFLKKGSPV